MQLEQHAQQKNLLNEEKSTMQRQMREDQLDEKSDTLCGRKRTFKNTKIGKASNSTKKQVMTDKDAYTLIVPESI